MESVNKPLQELKVDENRDLNAEQPEEITVAVTKIIETLDLVDRAYFGKDKLKVLRAKIEEAMVLLEQKPLDLVQAKKEKAELLYLRGRCLDFIPQYTKQAEEYLSKSIKLAPSCADAWRALAHVFWKKGDLEQAKQTFEGCLNLVENDKVALRQLSIVYRQFTTSSTDRDEPIDIEEKKANYTKSIDLAKSAIKADMKDSQSWYVLGNAHMTNFFVHQEQATQELELALKAYMMAEKFLTEPNPDLYFNRATVLEYLERYGEAIADFGKAHKIDPNLDGERRAECVIGYVSRVYNAIRSKGKIKTNKLYEMVRSIPQQMPQPLQDKFTDLASKIRLVSDISELHRGDNPDLMLSAKVVNKVERSQNIPMCFLLVDGKHNFCVLSIYHYNQDISETMRAGCEVFIRNPHLVLIQLPYKGYTYSYQCLKVTDMTSLLVNNQTFSDKNNLGDIQSTSFCMKV